MTHFLTNAAGETRHAGPSFGLDVSTVYSPDGEEFARVLHDEEVWTVGFPGTFCCECVIQRMGQLTRMGVIPRGRDATNVELSYEDGITFVQFEVLDDGGSVI